MAFGRWPLPCSMSSRALRTMGASASSRTRKPMRCALRTTVRSICRSGASSCSGGLSGLLLHKLLQILDTPAPESADFDRFGQCPPGHFAPEGGFAHAQQRCGFCGRDQDFFRYCSCSASCGAGVCPVADFNAGDDGFRCATSVGGTEHRDEFGGGQVRKTFALAFPAPVFLLVCHAAQTLAAPGYNAHWITNALHPLATFQAHDLDYRL